MHKNIANQDILEGQGLADNPPNRRKKMTTNKSFLTTDEVAELLRIPKNTIYQFTHRREIPFYKVGRKCLFKIEDVQAFLESRYKPVED